MHGLEATFGDRVNFVYLDIDDPRTNPFKAKLGYIAQPHIFLLDPDGKVLAQWLGPIQGDEVRQAILQALGEE